MRVLYWSAPLVLVAAAAAACNGGHDNPGGGGTGGTSHPSGDAGGNDAGGNDAGGNDAGGNDAGGDASTDIPWTNLRATHNTVGTDAVTPGNPGTADVTFAIQADQDVHAISPLIYGINITVDGTADLRTRVPATNATTLRQGGNRFSAFNWETNASNAGMDWNNQSDNFFPGTTPGATYEANLLSAKNNGTAALITMSLQDYVAGDEAPPGDVGADAGTSADGGPSYDYLTTRFKQNRFQKPGAPASWSLTPDTSDGYVYEDEMLAWAASKVGSGQLLISLDNEPELWSYTHPRIRPPLTKQSPLTGTPISYDQFIAIDLQAARAVRAAAPQASTLGYVGYGWGGFQGFDSTPADTGKGDFLTYYVKQVAAAEATEGKRLIDYLDIHWYPEDRSDTSDVKTRITTGRTDAVDVATRLAAPRSLWDSTFVEPSWIPSTINNGPVKLLPRIQDIIKTNNPGMKLSISEWDYGAGSDVSGAVASADVLGIFGAYGVDMATTWAAGTYVDAAFQAYRNIDAHGLTFGDTHVKATTSDTAMTSVYASYDSKNPGDMVIVAINKNTTAKTAAITVAHKATYPSAAVFVLDGTAAHPLPKDPIQSKAANAFLYTMPPVSVSILVPVTTKLTKNPGGWALPKPALGWTFDKDAEGFILKGSTPDTLEAQSTVAWSASANDASTSGGTSGGLTVTVPFTDAKQQVNVLAPLSASNTLNLSNTVVTARVRLDSGLTADPGQPGGAFIFAMDANYRWVMGQWAMVNQVGQWVTLTFDTNAVVAANPANDAGPAFDPTTVNTLGILLQTGSTGTFTAATYSVDNFVRTPN